MTNQDAVEIFKELNDNYFGGEGEFDEANEALLIAIEKLSRKN